jgi:uncharacterized protein YjiS (DUF1127 family)
MTSVIASHARAGVYREDRPMFLALLIWIAGEIRARRAMRRLEALSDEGLRDIGLSRGLIEGAVRRHPGLWTEPRTL